MGKRSLIRITAGRWPLQKVIGRKMINTLFFSFNIFMSNHICYFDLIKKAKINRLLTIHVGWAKKGEVLQSLARKKLRTKWHYKSKKNKQVIICTFETIISLTTFY